MFEDIPTHLRQFVAEQSYQQRYSPRDQAVWRYVMRQLMYQLRGSAHAVYFDGLAETGISAERIPSIEEMNKCLARLGWRAIAVDGFIPPQAFMELQKNRILAIAMDMRSVDQILYTPAPDIIHEAAGHAPIIADPEYSEYLQRFGEIGVKAMYTAHDLATYEAIRQLSIAKQNPCSSDADIRKAEAALEELGQFEGPPSELALLGRLHWWTVEYGLVGTSAEFRLFGAGLLSSLGESNTCLKAEVNKLPLTADAILTSYDITREQPQLFVTKSCRHLTQILEEFADTMCFRRGGAESLQCAIDSEVVTTLEYTSGLQVSGLLARLQTNAIGREIYIGTQGPTQLACEGVEIDGQGVAEHIEGFGSPVGRLCNLMQPLELASEYDLQMLGIKRDTEVLMEFVSGVTVCGHLKHIYKHQHLNVLMSFSECTVTGPAGELLFEPAWGNYDMAIGERIVSVYPGAADPSRFEVYPQRPTGSVPPAPADDHDQLEFELYRQLADLRESGVRDAQQLQRLYAHIQSQAPASWLLQLDMLELVESDSPLATQLRMSLAILAKEGAVQAQLIERGLRLLDNPHP